MTPHFDEDAWLASGPRRLAQTMLAVLPVLVRAKRAEDARALTTAVEVLWPEHPWGGLQAAIVSFVFGQVREALALLGDRNDTEALAMRALCLRTLGDPSWRGLSQEVVDRADSPVAIDILKPFIERDGMVPLPVYPPSETDHVPPIPFLGGIRA